MNRSAVHGEILSPFLDDFYNYAGLYHRFRDYNPFSTVLFETLNIILVG